VLQGGDRGRFFFFFFSFGSTLAPPGALSTSGVQAGGGIGVMAPGSRGFSTSHEGAAGRSARRGLPLGCQAVIGGDLADQDQLLDALGRPAGGGLPPTIDCDRPGALVAAQLRYVQKAQR